MKHFYSGRRTCIRWEGDLRWLHGEDRSSLETTSDPELFAEGAEFAVAYRPMMWTTPILGARRRTLVQQAAQELERAAMRTEYTLANGSHALNLENVIGAVAHDGWMNNAVIQFACETTCSFDTRAQFMSSLAFMTVSLPTPPPRSRPGSFSFILFASRGIIGESSPWRSSTANMRECCLRIRSKTSSSLSHNHIS